MNASLINPKGNYGAIHYDNTSCQGYYIIRFSSPPCTLKEYLNIDGHVISSGEMACKEIYFYQ